MTGQHISMMVAIALAGCGSDGGTEITGDGAAGVPLYAVQHSVPNVSDGYDGYVGFVSSLEPQQVDPSRSLEVTGGGFLSGTPLLPSTFFVASAEAPTVTRGRLVVDVTSAGNDLVFQALDESLIAIGPETTRGDLIGATAWPWAYASLDALGSDSPYTPIPAMAVGQVASLRAIVDGHTFVQVTDADAKSRLFDVTDPALPVESIAAGGFIDAVLRLR